jgi:predicted nucleotidyltransferase component of viral defense system
MIDLNYIQIFFPPVIKENQAHRKYMVKEYVQLMILDFLSTSTFVKKIVFIGGTNLRLVRGIDRFSEDLDFDCKNFDEKDFNDMTQNVLSFLKRSGFNVETRKKSSEKLKAFRSSIYFPELLFELGLSGYREERFLLKIESQNQGVEYKSTISNIKGCGFFFPFPVPPDDILCSMKLSALLSRQKGRDFYDAMFLLPQTKPNYAYLSQKCGVHNRKELKTAIEKMLKTVDLHSKSKDFEHLLFNTNSSNKILLFKDFINSVI